MFDTPKFDEKAIDTLLTECSQNINELSENLYMTKSFVVCEALSKEIEANKEMIRMLLQGVTIH